MTESPPYSLRNSMETEMSIWREFNQMRSNPSKDFKCLPLPGNLFDWQFAIRGPNGTDFENGIYHGRVQFPEGYPRKRPTIKLLTENGCFKTQTDISYPLFCRRKPFTLRDALHRLIELLPTYPDGALGSVGYDKEKRRELAIKSREAPPKYGTAERQKLIDEIEQHATTAATYIEKELEEMQSNPSDDFKCFVLAGNVYDWQVAFRGPSGTEFEGGIYHAHIRFPEEYPLNCPTFMLLTENGRFETQTEIWFDCHTSNVRDALLRLIEMLPSNPDGALGLVKCDKEKRRDLAIKSREAPPKYGTDERQKLIDEIHKDMLSDATRLPLPSNRVADIGVSSQNDRGKRKRHESFVVCGNTFNGAYSEQVGIFGFKNKSSKKGKQVIYSRETSSTSSSRE